MIVRVGYWQSERAGPTGHRRWRQHRGFDEVVGQSRQHGGQVVTTHPKLIIVSVTRVLRVSLCSLVKLAVAQERAGRQTGVDRQLCHAGYVLGCGAECAEFGDGIGDMVVDADHVEGMPWLNAQLRRVRELGAR